MNYVKFLVMILSATLVFQSCDKDETLVDAFRSQSASGNGGNNNGNNGNNNGNNSNNGNQDQDVEDIAIDILHEWTSHMLSLEQYTTGMRPNASARALAYINLAVYETAVPGMRRLGSTTRDFDDLSIRRENVPNRIDFEIAINASYAAVVDHFFINLPQDKRASIAAFESNQLSSLEGNISSNIIEESIKWGRYVAKKVIEFSETDEEAERQILNPQPNSYVPQTGNGFWTFSADPERALFPYWESVRTFVVSPYETTTIAPKTYSEIEGSPYYEEMMEVYTENNAAKTHNPEQLWIAEFWSDDVENLMISPPARQFSIANQMIEQFDVNLEEALGMYVKLGFSLNDAAVATWKYKYEYMVMRPSNYIHEFIDPDFQTNLYRLVYWPNPSFPGYPSGHSCFASAAAGIFIDYFGNDTHFIDRTHEGRTEFQGAPRAFNTLRDMAAENAYSRIPLGVHIRMDCTEGLRLGYEISDAINEYDLKRDHP